MEVSLAAKGDTGNWKENSFLQKTPKACSSLKSVMGNGWKEILYSFGVQYINCPIQPVIY